MVLKTLHWDLVACTASPVKLFTIGLIIQYSLTFFCIFEDEFLRRGGIVASQGPSVQKIPRKKTN